MAFLWIILGIILFFAILCVIPLRLRIRLEDTFLLTAGIGPIVLFRTPAPSDTEIDLRDFTYRKHQKRLQKEKAVRLKKKQKQQAKAAKKEAKKTQKTAAAQKAKEIQQTAADAHQKENKLEGILAIVGCVLDGLPGLFGSFKCRIYKLDVTVGGKEAAETAKNFAVFSQSLAYLLEFLDNKTRLVPPAADTIAIRADFLLAKTAVKADFTLQIRVGQILRSVLSIGINCIKTMIH